MVMRVVFSILIFALIGLTGVKVSALWLSEQKEIQPPSVTPVFNQLLGQPL